MKLSYERKVNFYETDAQGIVHHSNYPRYFEECRGIFLENIGIPYNILRDQYSVEIVLLELNVKYLNPLKFADKFKVEFWVDSIDKYFFSFLYIIQTDKKVAEGYTKHCCIKSDNRKVIKVPEILKNKLGFKNGGKNY